MLVLLSCVGIIIHSSYYDTAELALKSHAQSSSLTSFFYQYANSADEDFHDRAVEYIHSFNDKSRIGVWVIDKNGVVVATSSGFDADADDMPDYEDAKQSGTLSFYTGKNSDGEKLMCVSVPLTADGGIAGSAVRFMTSLDDLDKQFLYIVIILILVFVVILSLVAFSGLYFIRSIVRPVEQISMSARTIAAGNYETKIPIKRKYGDEITGLCHTFNDMAASLEDYNRMKNDFISTVSHELRTPLTAIKGWGETVAACPEDAETVRYATGIILSETENLNTMVEDLLDFSKIESGRLRLNPLKLDGIAELTDAATALTMKATQKGLKFNYIENDDIAIIFADPLRLRQVFVNIIDNAIKYTDEGSVTVSSSVTDNSFVAVVSDTGCGIPADFIPHLKEKFFKANMSKKGSGIGLAVCDEILKMLGGEFLIESTEGKGTRVTISLPLMKE